MKEYFLNISTSGGKDLFKGNGMSTIMTVETIRAFLQYPIPWDEHLIVKCGLSKKNEVCPHCGSDDFYILHVQSENGDYNECQKCGTKWKEKSE